MPVKREKTARRRVDDASAPVRTSDRWAWALLVATLVFIAVIRIRLLQAPLERDEGEFAYMGQLILQGVPPYKLACNMKLPGTYLMYALFLRVFGQTIAGVHLGLLVMNLISTVLVFFLARRTLGPVAAVVASASFGLLSLSPSVRGTCAHATQYVLPFALGGILLMLAAADSRKTGMLVLSGLLLGVAFLMKQHAVFFLLFAFLYYLWSQARRAPLGRLAIQAGMFSIALVMPYALTCLVHYKLGVFAKFWFWTWTYSREYAAEVSLADGTNACRLAINYVTQHSRWLWMLAGVGLTALIWDKKARASAVFASGFLVFSFLTVCPGMYFRPHYFVTLLPALAILMGAAVMSATEVMGNARLLRLLPLVLFVALLSHFVVLEREFLFRATPDESSIMVYGDSQFVAMPVVGEYIKTHSTSKDKIVVFGSEPEVYFYAQRRSGTTFIYMYGLMGLHEYALQMQKDMIREIKESKPEFVVLVFLPTSWTMSAQSHRMIVTQGMKYFAKRYDAVGFAEFVSKDSVAYVWDEDAKGYRPKARWYLVILRKLPSSHE